VRLNLYVTTGEPATDLVDEQLPLASASGCKNVHETIMRIRVVA
jgi:hypothetical protein